jgi:hypothetical protein
MDLNRLTHEADDLIRKVVSRYNQLYVPAARISQVELDLMLDDMRKLYDTFKTIGQVNLTLLSTIKKPEVSVNTSMYAEPQHPVSSSPIYTEKSSQEPEPTPAAAQPEPEIVAATEPVTETVTELEPDTGFDEEKNTEFVTDPEIEPKPVQENTPQAVSANSGIEKSVHAKTEDINPAMNTETSHAMLADKFNTGNKSLSETMASSQAQGVLGSRLLFQPIADLTSGIGLNDKFNFINELFGNNTAKYEEAITRINKAVNHDEANWILQKYHSVDWVQKEETVLRLKDFIKRRFI